jgi:hypothetical protein
MWLWLFFINDEIFFGILLCKFFFLGGLVEVIEFFDTFMASDFLLIALFTIKYLGITAFYLCVNVLFLVSSTCGFLLEGCLLTVPLLSLIDTLQLFPCFLFLYFYD